MAFLASRDMAESYRTYAGLALALVAGGRARSAAEAAAPLREGAS
jgi:hypothetical protein